MTRLACIFLDTSALFAGIWSQAGGARMLLRLGEAGAVRLLVSTQVLQEIDRVIRRKAPELLPGLAILLERCRAEVVSDCQPDQLATCLRLAGHPADGRVVAEAWGAQVDYFVTLDRQHFLENAALGQAVPFPLGTPGDCLDWLKRRLIQT